MQKTILITGSTDGIGLATAKMLLGQGHNVLLHGRSEKKLADVEKTLAALPGGGRVQSYRADLSLMAEVYRLAETISEQHQTLDVLINNAGVYKADNVRTADGLDLRFAVNTYAPFVLSENLSAIMGKGSRVVNLSSAAQASVDSEAMAGRGELSDMEAYSQSKLAITLLTIGLAKFYGDTGAMLVAVNPGSLLASKMVKEGFGVEGSDINIGADILCRAALSDEFADASGKYYDNDSKQFATPHPDGLDAEKVEEVLQTLETVLSLIASE